jgi:shikimate dehydrogenase|tara:strand:- start:951 stop:1796 length:846 start_codon:yes stop_codon:yes gene_type:complete
VKDRVGIFGYPLSHSISPAFQQAAFDHLGIDVVYESWPVSPQDLPHKINELRSQRFLGANVTIPHKVAVLDLLDEVDRVAEMIGSVNTILNREGYLLGYNTDTTGLIRSLKDHGNFSLEAKNVLIIGAGGASRAAVFALLNEGVASVVIANRTWEKASRLASELDEEFNVRAIPFCYKELSLNARESEIIINCSSMGMLNGSAERESPLTAEQIPLNSLVCDMVYNPTKTPLIREAEKAGAMTLGGLPMLIYQGAESFNIWTSKEAPIDVMFRSANRALGI